MHKIYEMPVAEVYVHYVKKIRYMDKLVDELAKGRPME